MLALFGAIKAKVDLTTAFRRTQFEAQVREQLRQNARSEAAVVARAWRGSNGRYTPKGSKPRAVALARKLERKAA